MSLLDTSLHKPFLKALHAWYKVHGRHDMPWRKTTDPYAIMVSEFMLQQTTVSTVKPYYERFLKAFPTLLALAKADLNEVLALWSGLGYYARARNLWAAAKTIVEQHRGKIPSDQKTLEELPGIGFYTSGAISSLAFNKPAIVMDGNIIRVLMRLLALDDEPKLKAVQVILRKLSWDLGNESRTIPGGPHDFILAIMDLGATLCAPQNPECMLCPVREHCNAQKFGKQNEIPYREPAEDRPTVRLLSAVITHNDQWLLGQRPAHGLFGGLWEFPSMEVSTGTEPIPTLEQWVQEQTGIKIQVRQAIPAFEHQLTHRLIVMRPYECDVLSKRLPKQIKKTNQYQRWAWVVPAQLSRYGVSTLTRRILAGKI